MAELSAAYLLVRGGWGGVGRVLDLGGRVGRSFRENCGRLFGEGCFCYLLLRGMRGACSGRVPATYIDLGGGAEKVSLVIDS